MIKDIFLDIFFPKTCLGCGKEGKYICDNCQVFLSESIPVCPVCGYSSPKGKTHSKHLKKHELDGLTSLWDYEGLVKEIINVIRNQGVTDIIKEIVDKVEIAEDICITYVPMELRKQKKRGFNQAEVIAKELAITNNCEIINMFKKEKEIIVNKKIKAADKILLVDDVFLTGNTMRECSKLLKQAGSSKVWGFVLARQA